MTSQPETTSEKAEPLPSGNAAQAPQKETLRANLATGIVALFFSAMFAYWFMYRPVHLALTVGGVQSFSFKAVIAMALLLYIGIVALTGGFAGANTRTLDANGKPVLSPKAKRLSIGAGVAMAVAAVGWYACLYALGIRLQWF